MRNHLFVLGILFALGGATSALSAPAPAPAASSAPAPVYEDDVLVTTSENFLSAHPDLQWRNRGESAYQKSDHAQAQKNFRRAARYADKPSQAMLATMLWNGKGSPPDHALAYAWMDLAAERGYPEFLATRERYWQALSADERKRALEVGTAIYAEFGDAVAKRRLELELARARTRVTGSSLGRAGNVPVQLRLPGGGVSAPIPSTRYYDPRYWEPEQYWQWQDRKWKPPSAATVEVGPVQPVESTHK